jgi:hypothetical protein
LCCHQDQVRVKPEIFCRKEKSHWWPTRHDSSLDMTRDHDLLFRLGGLGLAVILCLYGSRETTIAGCQKANLCFASGGIEEMRWRIHNLTYETRHSFTATLQISAIHRHTPPHFCLMGSLRRSQSRPLFRTPEYQLVLVQYGNCQLWKYNWCNIILNYRHIEMLVGLWTGSLRITKGLFDEEDSLFKCRR